MKGTRGKPNEQLFPRQVVIQLPKIRIQYLNNTSDIFSWDSSPSSNFFLKSAISYPKFY